MPRGKYVNHKGRNRHFTAPEELEQQTNEESSEEESSGEESSEEEKGGATGGASKPKTRTKKPVKPSSSEEDSDDSGEDPNAKKGVASLIEIENPNRQLKKATVKLEKVSMEDQPNISKSEKKQLEAKKRYDKLQGECKTYQAKADLARLAIIRQQRAEAAAKREAEKKQAEERKAAGSKS